MEPTDTASPSFTDDSHDTALCLLLPEADAVRSPVDCFRSLNDKAYAKWPAHVNLIYPFAHPDKLEEAASVLTQNERGCPAIQSIPVLLDQVDVFKQKRHNTIVLRPTNGGQSDEAIRSASAFYRRLLGMEQKSEHIPHMTLAQSEDSSSDVHRFLLEKARLLAPRTWEATQIALMIRTSKGTPHECMKIWATIDSKGGMTRHDVQATPARTVEHQMAFKYDSTIRKWNPMPPLMQGDARDTRPEWKSPLYPEELPAVDRLIVASYNVLAEFEWPPSKTRFPQLISNLLSNRAAADILCLQEVSDDFMIHLLSKEEICERYPYATHGRPDDAANGPLPSLLNVVVLSKFPMKWKYLQHQRRHKCSLVLEFTTLCEPNGANETRRKPPMVLAAPHLSQGLTDGAVATKKQEVKDILKYITTHHSDSPYIIAGDFNITTSIRTIQMAVKQGTLSNHAAQTIRSFDRQFSEAGLCDVWLHARLRNGESSSKPSILSESLYDQFEGEQGATFDPLHNTQSIRQTGGGANNRPQRYDRILISSSCKLQPAGFNLFGQETTVAGNDTPEHASDHWGIRCLLQRPLSNEQYVAVSIQETKQWLRTGENWADGLDELKFDLAELGLLPTPADEAARFEVIDLLRRLLVEEIVSNRGGNQRHKPALVLVPVGSTALGVWTPDSDIDCLCIGGIASKTFFTLALRRLRMADKDDVRVIRKVRANTGVMLELKVKGIKVDLQYCASLSIAEQYPEILNRPPNDPAFALSNQTLLKLKPARDVAYLRRSIPDMTQYRAAHILIKAWAKSRGIYAPKFGYLGGIHISVLLVSVFKSLVQHSGTPTVQGLIYSFFARYAHVDWSKEMVIDPVFHKYTKYHRSFREPICLLGWHAPSLNTAAAASIPTARVMAKEFTRASERVGDVSWQEFLGRQDDHMNSFLTSYKTYVKIELHYWGTSREKGSKFLGWFESRCPNILVDMNNKIPLLMPRIWPQRLTDVTDKAASTEHTEYQGCYLIGLAWDDPPLENSNLGFLEQKKAGEANLRALLPQFESRLQEDEAYYDPRSCWLHFTLVRGSDLGAMQTDSNEWGADLPEDDEWSDQDELEDGLEDTDEIEADDQGAKSAVRRPKTGSAGVEASGPNNATTLILGKFRTATDVLNRLRWDANMDPGNFVIGYEDRFAGAQEKVLDQWKSDLTHEEFIPQHRILYFRRKSDGRKVWERSTRIDDIFGSGIRRDTEDLSKMI